MVSPRYARPEQRKDYRKGYYTRDFVTRFGTLRLRIARTRKKGFLPAVMKKFQRRAEEVALLIQEAFLRGISTRQVGRVVRVSPQTVWRITQELDQAVRQFHQARLDDDWAYLFLDGLSLRVRRPAGRKRVQMLVADGVKRDGRRELLAFMRTRGESQADWGSLLQDLFRRGLERKHLQLNVTDGCPGWGLRSRRFIPVSASALLGAQDAQHTGESQKARLRAGQCRTRRRSIKRKTANKPRRRVDASADVGNGIIPAWFDNWSETCRNCCRSSPYPGSCGRSYEPPTLSSAVSWK